MPLRPGLRPWFPRKPTPRDEECGRLVAAGTKVQRRRQHCWMNTQDGKDYYASKRAKRARLLRIGKLKDAVLVKFSVRGGSTCSIVPVDWRRPFAFAAARRTSPERDPERALRFPQTPFWLVRSQSPPRDAAALIRRDVRLSSTTQRRLRWRERRECRRRLEARCSTRTTRASLSKSKSTGERPQSSRPTREKTSIAASGTQPRRIS